MNKRQLRQNAIRTIVRGSSIKTQRDLVTALSDAGFACTQATVSRDIVEMGLAKSEGGCYTLPEDDHLKRMVQSFVLGVAAAGNIVVIRTTPGGANGVCAALDAAWFSGSLGTVAGDDTIIMIATTPEAALGVQDVLFRLGAVSLI